MNPTFLAYASLAGFPILGLLFDAFLPRHRAVVATLLVGFLFLPALQIDLAGAIYWNRYTAPIFVIFLGVLFRDGRLIAQLRLRWFDWPMIIWCLVPFGSAVANGFGAYEGLSLVFYQTIRWGGPYLLGRIHFQTREQLLDLVRMLFLGGLLYLPFCLVEIRISPVFHNWFYGFHQQAFSQSLRGSFYRPTVFLANGLVVAMWMATTAFLGWSLLKARLGVRYLGLPAGLWVGAMVVVFLGMQSLGAVVLAFFLWVAVSFCRATHWKWPLVGLALIPFLWAGARTMGALPAATITEATSLVSAERAHSLNFRLQSEDRLTEHTLDHPLLGWSTRGFNKVQDDFGEVARPTIADGQWLIAFAAYGIVGVLAMLFLHLVPTLVALRYAPPWRWASEPMTFVAGALGMVIAMISLDNIFNAMASPLFMVAAAALPTVLTGSDWDPVDPEVEASPAAQLESGHLPFGRPFGTRVPQDDDS